MQCLFCVLIQYYYCNVMCIMCAYIANLSVVCRLNKRKNEVQIHIILLSHVLVDMYIEFL